jgi:outer membrane protein TolC
MKDKARIIMTAVTLLAAALVQAQDTRPLGLNEAIDLSLKNSKQLKVSTAKIDEATAALKEAVQRKLPDASATASYLRLTNANVSLKTKDNSGGGSTNPPPSISQAAYGILNLSLPIYAGGRIRYGIESSRLLEKAARLDADNDREDVIENTIEAYINLYKAKSARDIVNRTLTQAQQRVKDFSNLEQNGLLARNDLLKAQLQVSNTELSLLDADNNWQLANVSMDLLLGLPEKTVLVPDSALLAQKLDVKDLDSYVQAARANRKDVEALDLRKQAAEVGVKSTKGEYYPNIQLSGGYIAADIPKVITITNAANIGLGVSYNVGSIWKTKAKVEGAEARARQIAATQDMMNDQVRLQVSRSYLNLLSGQKKIDVNAKAVEQANENYRITKNKYDNSLATATELLDAEVAQLQAQLNYEFSRADAIVAYNQLLQVAGQLNQK